MGSCTRRHFLLSTCFLQMITIIERQVFDFLGYMWAPIFVNFFHILFIIFGFYGAYHFRIKYIITYLIWNFLWIGWNAFLICFYLNVGTLDRDSDLLNLGTGSVSWFEVNGYGCKPTYNTNITSEDPFRPIRPERVDDCLLTYDIVEVVHSGVQCILAFFGILGAILISYIFLDEDDRFDFMNGDAKSPQHTVVHPMYVSYTSIPTSASATMLSNKHHHHHQHSLHHSLSNSNHHLSNSSHALATTATTTPTTTINNTNTATPSAAKKQFRSSISSNSQNLHQHHHHQQLSSLHRQFSNSSQTNAVAAAAAAHGPNATSNNNLLLLTNSFSNNNSKNNSHSNNNRHNATATTNSNTFLIHTHKSNRSNPNTSQYNLNNKGLIMGGGGGGPGSGPTMDGHLGSYNGSLLSNSSQYQQFNNGPVMGSGRRSRQPLDLSPMSTSYNTRSYSTNNSNASNSMLYSPKQARKMSPLTSNSIFPANTATAIDLVQKQTGGGGVSYYDDSTAKADHQFYVNGGGGSRRHMLMGGASVSTPTQDTTPSLSYASLQNSNQNLNSSLKHHGGGGGGLGSGMNTSLSNSNYSLTNSLNNNHPPSPAPSALGGGSNSGRFARIHSKPKPPKSSSYSNFGNATNLMTSNGNSSSSAAQPQTAVARNQAFTDRPLSSSNFDETFEDDNFSMQNLKPDDDITYVPFGKPTPGSYFVNKENNNITSYPAGDNSGSSPNNNNPQFLNRSSPPMALEGGGILLEKGAILHPHPDMNPAQRVIYQQNGLPFHPAYSPVPYRQNSACSQQQPQPGPPRPTNIPLPIVPASYNHHCTDMISPSEVTPPPPPQPRPHIFQPRTGTAPYPDLSPDVTERYAMPTQYIPRSPVASRIARRQRQQQQQNHQQQNHHHHNNSSSTDRSHNISANFCDQIRDTPPGYRIHKGVAIKATKTNETGVAARQSPGPAIVRARSHDRLSDSHNNKNLENNTNEKVSNGGSGGAGGSFKNRDNAQVAAQQGSNISKEMAPHVNRRSGRRGELPKTRPRSYCNSMSGGEGVIRGNIASDRKMGYAA